MSIREKAQQAREKNQEKMQGSSWWMPWTFDDLQEKLDNDDENLYRTMYVKSIEVHDSKYGEQLMLMYHNIETFEEEVMPVNGNLLSLISRLILDIEDSMDMTEQESGLRRQVMEVLTTPGTDLREEFSRTNLIFDIRYCGKLEIQSGEYKGEKAHSYTGEKVEVSEKDIDELEENLTYSDDVPF